MPEIIAKPRQGYLFLRAIVHPWGNRTKEGLYLELDKTDHAWFLVDSTPETAGGYAKGDAVYCATNQVNTVFLGNGDAVGLVHESMVKAEIKAGQFTPVLVDRTAETILNEAKKREERNNRPALAITG